MDELKQYVDLLFSHEKPSAQITDLKEEIYSNMLAKRDDLIQQGLPEAEAMKKAKENISSIDSILDNKQIIYINRYKTECLQTLLLSSVIMWILSIPAILVGGGSFSTFAFLLVIVFGVLYFYSSKKDQNVISFADRQSFKKVQKMVWLLWGIFFLTCYAMVTAVFFGSNIWFKRPVNISGPYQFGVIAVKYYIPLVTIAIPLAVNSFPKILRKQERTGEDE